MTILTKTGILPGFRNQYLFLTGPYMEFPLLLAVRNFLYASPGAVDTNPRPIYRERIT